MATSALTLTSTLAGAAQAFEPYLQITLEDTYVSGHDSASGAAPTLEPYLRIKLENVQVSGHDTSSVADGRTLEQQDAVVVTGVNTTY